MIIMKRNFPKKWGSERFTIYTHTYTYTHTYGSMIMLIRMMCVLQGGIYVLQIMDWYCATFSLMLLSFTECMVIAWIYGQHLLLSCFS